MLAEEYGQVLFPEYLNRYAPGVAGIWQRWSAATSLVFRAPEREG